MSKKIVIIFLAVIGALLSLKIVAHKHAYSNWVVKVNPTEETTGLRKRECKKCGKVEQEVIAKLVHVHDNEVEVVVDPTCIAGGILRNTCKKCGNIEELEVDVDVDGHNYSEWTEIKDKETETHGYKTRTCSLCNKVDEKQHEHELGAWEVIQEETCLATGLAGAQCVHCSYVKEQVLPIGGHRFTDWNIVKESTCVEKGFAERNCIWCNLKEESELLTDLTAHNFTDWKVIKQETTSEPGLISHECKVCKFYEEVVVPVHVHTYTEWEILTASTCSKGGTAIRFCETCDFKETSELKPDESLHRGEWKVSKQETCTSEGELKRTCTICGNVQTQVIEKKEHDYQLDDKSKPGYLLDKCLLCGHIKDEYKLD